MFKPAQKKTLHSNILAQLIESIKNGEWKPGDKLPGEMALTKQFQVSRNCIREVLKALALANIVEARPGNGTFITEQALEVIEGPSLSSLIMGDVSLWELKDIRTLLECHAAYLAAERATKSQIEKLQKALIPIPGTNHTEGHAQFHKILLEIANNKLLTQILKSVQKEMDLLRKKYAKLPTGLLETYTKEHSKIFEMVKEHRPDDARKAMLEHIENAWSDTLYDGLMDKKIES